MVVEECDENGDPLTDPEEEDDEDDEDYVPPTLGIAPEIPTHLLDDELAIDDLEQQAAIERKLEIDLSSQPKQKQYTAPTGEIYFLIEFLQTNFCQLFSVNVICESKEV